MLLRVTWEERRKNVQRMRWEQEEDSELEWRAWKVVKCLILQFGKAFQNRNCIFPKDDSGVQEKLCKSANEKLLAGASFGWVSLLPRVSDA